MERWAGNACRPGRAPCDDGAACTADTCTEAAGTCTHAVTGACDRCDAAGCVPQCAGRACGDDGCGGYCGTCPVGQTCVDNNCSTLTTPGTCASPLALLAPGEALEGEHVITGDTSMGFNSTVPSCNRASTARDLTYTFTLTEPMGIDFRVSGYDTVLSLRVAGCADDDPAMRTQPNWCSDDASPPGDYGSRLATMLPAGTYYLIVDGYDGTQAGPFTLNARFVRDCVPQCDGQFCGDDGCGGSCGACAAGETCSTTTFRCVASNCTPNCAGRQCGDDGCGGLCGACSRGTLCVTATGLCERFAACDHLRPVCRGGCGRNAYCGSDCACHDVAAPLPDLVVDRALLEREVVITESNFGPRSCAIVEGCVGGSGGRRLLRFSVAAVNQGQADLAAPPVEERPDLFQFGACHGHYHYQGFAAYELRDLAGRVVTRGSKQAYCMMDSYRVLDGPAVGCQPHYTCEGQGIRVGWADLYGNDLD